MGEEQAAGGMWSQTQYKQLGDAHPLDLQTHGVRFGKLVLGVDGREVEDALVVYLTQEQAATVRSVILQVIGAKRLPSPGEAND